MQNEWISAMRVCFLTILFLTFCSRFAFAQGEFLQRGVFGWGINATYQTSEDAIGYGGGIGHCFSGIFDLGVGVSRIDPKDTQEKYYTIDIAPYFAIYPVKQNEKIPISLMLGAQYEYAPSYGEYFTSYQEMITKLFSVNGSVFLMVLDRPAFKIQPSINYHFTKGHILYREGMREGKVGVNAHTIGVGLSLIIRTSQKSLMVFHTRYASIDGTDAFQLGLGFVVTKSQSEL